MNPYRAGFLQFVGVAETDAQAEELYAEPARYFFQRCMHVYRGFAEPPGYRRSRYVASRHRRPVPRRRRAGQSDADQTWSDYLDTRHVIAGSPAARRPAQRAGRPMNVGHLMLLLQFGNMGEKLTMKNIERFATEGHAQPARPLGRLGGPLVPDADTRSDGPARADRRVTAMPSTAFDVEVIRAGTGAKQLVYLHGFSKVTDDDAVVAALAANGASVIAPVAPGYNDLAELDAVRDIHELAMHYDDLLDDLGLDQATIIGHSFGGMIAAELAAHSPRRVAELVLAAPLGLWRDDVPAADFFAQPSPMHRDALLWSDPSRTSLPPESIDVEALVAVTQGLTAAGAFLWPLPDKGLARRLRRITARSLVIWGDNDEVVPIAYADDLCASVKKASKQVMKGCGHMAPYERPDEFAELVGTFLGR